MLLAVAPGAGPAAAAAREPKGPPAARTQATEYGVKAAFVYNFVQFVEWPPATHAPGAPLVVGVVGRDPFDGELERAFTGRMVKGRPVEVRHVAWGPAVRDCDVLFYGASESARAGDLAALVGDLPILTIADEARAGGGAFVIGFAMEEKRVGFVIDVDNAAKARLVISSKLLKLARLRRNGVPVPDTTS